MSYNGFLISNYATGLDRELQPWLLPDDSFVDLLDGYVYRGVVNKREGYSGFANGLKSTYCESRMVHNLPNVNKTTGAINSSNQTFTWALHTQVRRGTLVISGSNPVQTLTDNGVGGFTGNGTGTVNYLTGAVSITFTSAPIAASTVTATYDYHQGFPVMGIMNFYASDGTVKMIVADTTYVNRYDNATDRLVDISQLPPATPYTGLNNNFWSWFNYPDASNNARLLFANGKNGDVIQSYDGTVVTDYAFTLADVTDLNCTQLFQIKDRLVLFQTIEDGTLFPRRIRVSGFGANADVFDTTAPGAGVIDIPDNTWFYGAAFNRDDLIFFMEGGTWILKYTGDDVTPFVLERIDESRGSKAAFSVITYLNRTMAASPRGLIVSDGYRVDRMDDNIPQFTINDINNQYFNRCFSSFVDQDRDVYTIYPSVDVDRPEILDADESDRILITNFEEDNYAIYRLPLSCMGNYQLTLGLTWNDLTPANGFNTWQDFGDKIGTWESISYTTDTPTPIGGGHSGEVWEMNINETEDNDQLIRGITIIDPLTIEVTSDWNNYDIGDTIYFDGVGGMTEINLRQGVIQVAPANRNVFRVTFSSTDISGITNAYTSGGSVSRVIPFEFVSKKFNPYVSTNSKLRCGWLYFYVTTSDTDLIDFNGDPQNCFLDLQIIQNDNPLYYPTLTYKVDCTNITGEIGEKKWVKIWINQVGKFLQFKLKNAQAGSKVQIHAMMPGFKPVGLLV